MPEVGRGKYLATRENKDIKYKPAIGPNMRVALFLKAANTKMGRIMAMNARPILWSRYGWETIARKTIKNRKIKQK